MQTSISHAVLKQGLGALFCAGLSFVLVLVLARALGPLAFGGYVAVLNGATLGLIVVEGGWAQWLYRERAAADGCTWRSLMGMAVTHILLSTMALVLLSIGLADSGAWLAAWMCMGGVALMNLVSARMRGEGHFGREALWQSAGRAASAVVIVWVVWGLGWASEAAVFWAWAAGLAVTVLVGAPVWLLRPQWQGLWHAYPKALPFVVMALASAWLLKGDLVLLGAGLVPKDALSYYAACTRLTEAGLLLFAPLGNVLLRGFTKTATAAPGHQRALLWRVLSLVTALGGLAVAVAGAWGGALVESLFGADFAPAGVLLPWVLLMLPFALGNVTLLQWLTARRQERWAAGWMSLAGLALWWGVGYGAAAWGPQGAAAAVAVVQAALCGVLLWTVLRNR